jgi:hypothetical protein
MNQGCHALRQDHSLPIDKLSTMTRRYVDTEALNFRSRPEVAPSSLVGQLHFCQPVDVISESGTLGWVEVEATTDGTRRRGFVNANFLRAPVSDAREALVAQAIREWLRFERGLGKEQQDPYFRFIGEMWQAIGIQLDGKDTDVPWSAAAISFMVRNAAAAVPLYANFRFAAAHSRYIHAAVHSRLNGDVSAPFWGHRLHEQRPQIGDMVCRWRATRRSFDDAIAFDAYKSHCDIIVAVTPEQVVAIGGNVGDSVGITRYDKNAAGFLSETRQVFAHLVNRV